MAENIEEERWRLRARMRGYVAAITLAVFVFRLVALPLSVVLWVAYRWRRLRGGRRARWEGDTEIQYPPDEETSEDEPSD